MKNKFDKGIIYININGYATPLQNLKCGSCDYRYSIICPNCEWNKKGKYNTYARMNDKEIKNCKGVIKIKGAQ